MKLFQIEEPSGGPTDPNEPGAAIGIEATGARAEVTFRLAEMRSFSMIVPGSCKR